MILQVWNKYFIETLAGCCRCGRYPSVVRTAVPVDGRFEHIVLSCNMISDHAIIWIEREAQRGLDVSLNFLFSYYHENPFEIIVSGVRTKMVTNSSSPTWTVIIYFRRWSLKRFETNNVSSLNHQDRKNL